MLCAPITFEDFQDIDESMLNDYFEVERRGSQYEKQKISTSKLLDEIYDVHLQTLPQDLFEAMERAEQVR
jgi:hypothetical protein